MHRRAVAQYEAMLEERLRPMLPPKPEPGEQEDIPAALATYDGFEAFAAEDPRYARAPARERCGLQAAPPMAVHCRLWLSGSAPAGCSTASDYLTLHSTSWAPAVHAQGKVGSWGILTVHACWRPWSCNTTC